MNYIHDEKNKIVKNKVDRLIMINLLLEYGRELKKVRLTENNSLNEEILNKCSNDELFNIYGYYSTNDEDEPEMTSFKNHKYEFLTKNPQHNPKKNINRKQATDLIIFFYKYHNKENDIFISNVKKNKVKIYDLIKFIRYNIKNPFFYIDELINEDIENDLHLTPSLLKYMPNFKEWRFESKKALNYNIKISLCN